MFDDFLLVILSRNNVRQQESLNFDLNILKRFSGKNEIENISVLCVCVGVMNSGFDCFNSK